MKMPEQTRALIRCAKAAYVASVDQQGRPHIAVSKLIRLLGPEHVTFTGWFCPQTAENVAKNPKVAISIWNEARDHGYQLIGEVADAAVTAVLNGVSKPGDEFDHVPQEERRLTVHVDAVLEMTSSTHSDDAL